MTRADARKFIHAYFDRFARVRDYIASTREAASRDATVTTLFGRVRRFPELRGGRGRAEVEQALRGAVNTTIQGTAADLMKLAMLRVEDALGRAGLRARMLLQVHDELLFEVPEDELSRARAVVREAMEGVHALDVPLVVDQKAGRSWMEVT
jgi:DNA polymerase-1